MENDETVGGPKVELGTAMNRGECSFCERHHEMIPTPYGTLTGHTSYPVLVVKSYIGGITVRFCDDCWRDLQQAEAMVRL